MPDRAERVRPAANGADQKIQGRESATSVTEPAGFRADEQGWQRVPADEPTALGDQLTCTECGCRCPWCTLLRLQDREAVWKAAYQAGVIAGRMQAVAEDVAALEDLQHIIGYLTHRATVAAIDGPNAVECWANERTDSGRWSV